MVHFDYELENSNNFLMYSKEKKIKFILKYLILTLEALMTSPSQFQTLTAESLWLDFGLPLLTILLSYDSVEPLMDDVNEDVDDEDVVVDGEARNVNSRAR